MDLDEDDDFYAPDESEVPVGRASNSSPAASVAKQETPKEELEEGEEEDEGEEMDEDDDSEDVDIITEHKDGTKAAAPPSQVRYNEIRNIPQRSTSRDSAIAAKAAPAKASAFRHPPPSTTDFAAGSTSKIDVNAIPMHKGTGKPITQINIDEDLPENDKPWRKAGTDLSDYFNYGFDEFTWALYAQKQETLRGEYNADAFAQSNKKMMEEMANMMMGGMIPPGASAGASGGAPPMPGIEGLPPEMQAMMQQMMAAGMDPSQLGDPSAMAGMFAGMQGSSGAGTTGSQGGHGQNYGAFAGNPAQGFGFEQGQNVNVGSGGRGSFGSGRGRRGGQRNW